MRALKRLLAALALIGFSACNRGQPTPAATADKDGGTATIGIHQVGSLDPAVAGGSGLMMLATACDGLVGLEPGAAEPQPALAQSWEVEPGGAETVVQLRAGLEFQDGSALDGRSIAANLIRVAKTPGSPWAYLLESLEGYAEVVAGSAEEFTGVRARGETIEFRLSKPDADFISVFSHPALTPISPKEIENARSQARALQPVCAGPYRIKIQGESLTELERNPDYRPVNGAYERDGEGYLEEIAVKQFGSPAEAFAAFKSQQVELAPIPNDLFAAGEAERFGHEAGDTPEIEFLAFNVSAPKTSSAQVRRSISLALNRLAIVDAALGDEREPLAGWFAAGTTDPTSSCRRLAPKASDSEQAKAELTQSTVDPTSISIPLRFDSARVSRVLAQAIEVQVKEGLAIPLSSEPTDSAGLEATLKDRSLDGLWMMSRSHDLPIAGRLLATEFESSSPRNLTGLSDPEFNDLLAQARTTADNERRRKLYQDAETRVCEQMPAIPLWSGVSHWVYDSSKFDIESRAVDATGNLVLRHVRSR